MRIVVRYHEIALKGRNRPFFVEKLAQNLKKVTSDIPGARVFALDGRLSLELPDSVGWDDARARVSRVFGVANFSPCVEIAPEIGVLCERAAADLAQRSFSSFRVSTKRSNKAFPMISNEIDRAVGAAVVAATGKRVDLTHPELTLYVEVLRDRILYSFEKVLGPGGFAVGSSGRVMALLSGGIDSPVAAWRLMKRGCRVTLVHFHAFPLLDHTTIDKARELTRILTRFQFSSRLLLVPFGAVQQEIVAACPGPLRVVLYRRFMVRIAEALAAVHHTKALVTGESLGQVASQTLDNMVVIDAVAKGPILRPLVGMDKEEITQQARHIGSFEVSTLPDQDCCQLFMPRSVATAATLAQVLAAEQPLDVEALVARAVDGTTRETFRDPVSLGSPAGTAP